MKMPLKQPKLKKQLMKTYKIQKTADSVSKCLVLFSSNGEARPKKVKPEKSTEGKKVGLGTSARKVGKKVLAFSLTHLSIFAKQFFSSSTSQAKTKNNFLGSSPDNFTT
jgi:hypothetical protein